MNSLPDMSSIRKTGFTPEADSGAVHDAPRVQQLSQTRHRRQRLKEARTGARLQRPGIPQPEEDDDEDDELAPTSTSSNPDEQIVLLPEPKNWGLYQSYRKNKHPNQAFNYMKADEAERRELLRYEAQQNTLEAREWKNQLKHPLAYLYNTGNIADLDLTLWDYIVEMAQQNTGQDAIVKELSPLIRFDRNSINLVIGKRGSGKTFVVLREILKLLYVDKEMKNFNYTACYYVSDKANDDTVQIFEPLFKEDNTFRFIWIPTVRALNLIKDIESFTAKLMNPEYKLPEEIKEYYSDPKHNETGLDPDTEKFAKVVLNTWNLDAGVVPNTLILFDDCIGLFKKDSELSRKLYQNRQSRITAFLILQDVHGLSSSMKSNVNSLLLFGGFSRQKWNSLMYQLPSIEPYDFYEYSKLSEKDGFWVNFEEDDERKKIKFIAREKTAEEIRADEYIRRIKEEERKTKQFIR